jgi:hypothetical protein
MGGVTALYWTPQNHGSRCIHTHTHTHTHAHTQRASCAAPDANPNRRCRSCGRDTESTVIFSTIAAVVLLIVCLGISYARGEPWCAMSTIVDGARG